jgi:hypothetical protein
MRIIGSIAELGWRERELFHCESEVPVAELDCVRVLGELATRERVVGTLIKLQESRLARRGIAQRMLERDRDLIHEVAGQVMVYELEEVLDIPHRSMPHPRGLE